MDDPKERGLYLERLVFFSDAVLALVITLLVLPLTSEVDLLAGDDLVARSGICGPISSASR